MNCLFKCSDVNANLLDNNVIKSVFMAIGAVAASTRALVSRVHVNTYKMLWSSAARRAGAGRRVLCCRCCGAAGLTAGAEA